MLGNIITFEPKVRPLWLRSVYAAGLMFIFAWRTVRLPSRVWPSPLREILENWTPAMYGAVIGSWVTKAYIDQPCRLRAPETPAPLVETADRYRLSQEDLDFFYDKGYLGPYDAMSAEEAKILGRLLLAKRSAPSATFGIVTDRDLHLETPEMRAFMKRPEIVERAAQLLGPDLFCWRSQVFFKPPGAKAIQWHQASTYMLEDYMTPAIVPPDRDRLFQLTVWVAIDHATEANGCLQFLPGTQDRIRKIRFGGEDGFYHVRFRLECDAEADRATPVEVKPGQFLIFTERVVHASGPNRTQVNRLAFNFRIVPSPVRVYPGGPARHGAMHMGQSYDLSQWRPYPLRGAGAGAA